MVCFRVCFALVSIVSLTFVLGVTAQSQGTLRYTPMGAEQVKQTGPSDGAFISQRFTKNVSSVSLQGPPKFWRIPLPLASFPSSSFTDACPPGISMSSSRAAFRARVVGQAIPAGSKAYGSS